MTSGKLAIIVVHVNDCTIAASDLKSVESLKCRVMEHVETTDLGELHWLLGIEIWRNQEECNISLLQHSYID